MKNPYYEAFNGLYGIRPIEKRVTHKMNERIRELIEQCSEYSDMHQGVWFDKEKFAELIVRECLDQCYNRGMNDELYAGQLKAAAYIEQHFGVEE